MREIIGRHCKKHNKRLHLTTVSFTPCAGAQVAPATLAGEANVIPKAEERLNGVGNRMFRVQNEPLPTADQVRAVIRDKPSFSAESIDELLRKHGLGPVRFCESRSSYVPNVVQHRETGTSSGGAISSRVPAPFTMFVSQNGRDG